MLCGGLLFDLFDRVGSGEFLLGHRVEFFVCIEQLNFSIANLESFALPAVELLEDPQSVVRGIKDHQQDRIGINAVASGEKVFGEETDFERLGFDAKRASLEDRVGIESLGRGTTGDQDPFALGLLRCDGPFGGLPFQADLFDAEVVRSVDLELDLFGL